MSSLGNVRWNNVYRQVFGGMNNWESVKIFSFCVADLILYKRQLFFEKLMKRHVPIEFLEMLENWLCDSQACVNGIAYGLTFSELILE